MTQTKMHRKLREEWQVPPLEVPLGIGSGEPASAPCTMPGIKLRNRVGTICTNKVVQLSPESCTMVLVRYHGRGGSPGEVGRAILTKSVKKLGDNVS